jgi:uroporphyrinogen-III synthase
VRLLLTRPEPDAQRTAAALRARGHTAIVAPLLHIETVANAAIEAGPWTAIVVTSANAARSISALGWRDALGRVPMFAVGRRSAQAMRDIGFSDVISADGDVGDLVRLVAERAASDAPLLYLAGEDRSGDLAGDLERRGFKVRTAIVYRAVAHSDLPLEATAAIAGGVEGVLHFSKRTAEAYVEASRGAGLHPAALKLVHYCLSARVAEPLQAAGAPIVRIAPRPVEAALIDLVDQQPA